MKKKLFKSMLIISFLLITFFSVKPNDIEAASFAYEDFNWENFLEQHKSYWVSFCDEGDENCYDAVIKTQKKFYTRLYDLLTKYEKKGFKIKDYIIIETVFYGLTPDTFRDTGTKDEEYKGQNIEYGYTIDESEKKEKYLASDDGDRPGAKDYFEKETDSLKTLLNNMIGYSQECYGESNETPHTVTNSDGTTSTVCNGELTPMNGKCVAKMKTLQANFFDSIGLTKLFGSNNKKKCEELTKDYVGYTLGDVSPKSVDEDLYWDFLINNTYFDNKFQLQYYFETVISKTDHKKMSELTDDEYEKYNDEIVAARTRIVESIKDIIKSYGEFAETPSSMNSTKKNLYWWPIGSTEVTEQNGVKFANLDPASTEVASKFGARTDPFSGQQNTIHRGIDISGVEGVTPVVAAMSGVVVVSAEGTTGTCTVGNKECGGGYGNYVVIQHPDGNFTLYAHMATNSVIVKEGDNVKQGQVLGYVGNTGKSTGSHLHFEVRVGGNDSNSAQDPLKYISASEPRSSGYGSGDIIIPDEYGNSGFFTYTTIVRNWVYNQKKVYNKWISAGSQNDRNVATIDGRYLIACTSTFGKVGDKIDFFLEDGTKIETIMMDEKSQTVERWDPNPANKWGHNNGQQILEFEILSPLNNSGDVGSWMGWSGKRVASATNLGENIINNTD